jgi:glycerol uptake facilitator-like aquaporin
MDTRFDESEGERRGFLSGTVRTVRTVRTEEAPAGGEHAHTNAHGHVHRSRCSCRLQRIPITREEAFAELTGTFLLTMITVSVVHVSGTLTDDALTLGRILLVGLGYGMSYGAIMYTFSFDVPERSQQFQQFPGDLIKSTTTSIRQLNPMLTLTLLLLRQMSIFRAFLFWLLQASAALFAVAVTPLCLPPVVMQPLELLEDVSTEQSVLMAFIASFCYMLVTIFTTFGGGQEVNRQRENELTHQHAHARE